MMRTKTSFLKTIVLLFNWVTVNVGTYTLMLNATKLHGDIFLNYTLMALVNYIPGTVVLLITLKYFSRRANLFYGQFILGIHCNNKNLLCLKIIWNQPNYQCYWISFALIWFQAPAVLPSRFFRNRISLPLLAFSFLENVSLGQCFC